MISSSDSGGTDVRRESPHLSTTSVSLDTHTDSRQGIIPVMFGLPSDLLSWIANTWWDGKIETTEDGKTLLVPNAEYYKCPLCEEIYSVAWYPLYQECSGTKENPHAKVLTTPTNWHPLCSRTGISYLLGQLQANINSNIQTANFGKTSLDVKGNTDLDMRFLNTAAETSIAIMGSMLSNPNNYAGWLLEDKTFSVLPQVFNIPFLTSVMTEMGINIYSSFSKGKQLAAVSKLLENRAHIEQEILNKSERSALEQQLSEHNNSGNGLFNLSNILGRARK